MPARTLAYKVLLVSPLIYLGTIVFHSRVRIDTHVFTACTLKQQQAILAYRDYYMAGLKFQGRPNSEVDPQSVRSVARSWIEGMEDGTLQELTPVELEDYTREGVKAQIIRVRDAMCQHLVSCSKKELEAGNADGAASDLTLAMRLAEVLKYSDPYSVAHSGVMQRTALMHLPPVVERLTPNGKMKLRSDLKEVQSRQRPLQQMTRLITRLFKDKQGGASRELVAVEGLLEHPATANQKSVSFLASLPMPSEASTVQESNYVGVLRMSGSSQTMWLNQLNREIVALEQPVALVPENPQRSKVAWVTP